MEFVYKVRLMLKLKKAVFILLYVVVAAVLVFQIWTARDMSTSQGEIYLRLNR